MSDYNWLDFAGRPWVERYPDWVEGFRLWQEYAGAVEQSGDELLDALVRARASVTWGVPGTELGRPRLFVSHRRDDTAQATHVAALAKAEGFQVWLDVENPSLQTVVQRHLAGLASPRDVALVIEMALLNCTHVIAVMTSNTRGSTWVPYEYGRVKDSSPHSRRAASWIESSAGNLPEYLELGIRTRTDDETRTWLRAELAAWNRRYPASVPTPSTIATKTRRLTQEELERIKHRLGHGPGRDLPAPERASFENSRAKRKGRLPPL